MKPYIYTPRCIVRVPKISDAPLMQAAIQRSHSMLKLWMPWAESVASVRDTEHFLMQGIEAWNGKMQPHIEQPLVVMDSSNTEFIGATGVKVIDPEAASYEIGYWIDIAHLGQGFITEAANALAHYLFQEGRAKRIEICCEVTNERSCKVAKRLNFNLEAVLKNSRLTADKSQVTDTKVFVCTSQDRLDPLLASW